METVRNDFAEAAYRLCLQLRYGLEPCTSCTDLAVLAGQYAYAGWQELKNGN